MENVYLRADCLEIICLDKEKIIQKNEIPAELISVDALNAWREIGKTRSRRLVNMYKIIDLYLHESANLHKYAKGIVGQIFFNLLISLSEISRALT